MMIMLEKLREIIFPDNENILSLIVPTVIIVFIVIIFWVILLYLSKFIQKKSDEWLTALPDGNLENEKKPFRKFVILYLPSLKRSLSAIRIFLSSYLILMLISSNCLTIAYTIQDDHVKASSNVFDPKTSFFNYFLKAGHALDKFAQAMILVFTVVLVANWLIKALQYMTDAFLLKSTKSKAGEQPERIYARRKTLNSVTSAFLKFLVIILALFTILQNLGVNIAALLATAGVASVSFAFGAQSFLKDFISGFFIVLEDQFAVGDNVEINQVSGTVESMTFRVVRLRSIEGSVLIIPNGEIRIVRNFTADYSQVDFKIFIPVIADLNLVTNILQEEVERIKLDFERQIIGKVDLRALEKVVNFENKTNAVQFRVFIKTQNIKNKIKIESELNKRIIARLSDEGIKLP